MPTDFSIDCAWRSWTDDNLPPAEAATVCDLEIILAGKSLTQNIDDSGCKHESIFVSILPFAWWLCANFWRLCHEPGLPKESASVPVAALENWQIAHSMTSIGEGYAWPEVTFVADGNNERICCQAQDEQARQYQPTRFVASMNESIPKEIFTTGAMRMIKETAARVGDSVPDFLLDWNRLEQEYATENIANYRIIEAMLGRDTGHAPQSLMRLASGALPRLGWDTLCETAGALNPVYGVELANQDIEFQKALGTLTSGITARVQLPRMEPEDALPWEAGRNLAKRVRELTGIGPEKPLNKTHLLDWMGLTASRFNRIAAVGRVSICRVRDREVGLVFPRKSSGRYSTSRRFQLARALGGYLSLPQESQCLVMAASQTASQQIQRNFAAELLAPFAAIMAMLPNGRAPVKNDITAIASHFQASPRTIVHSLLNHGVLDANAAEMLLAA